MRAAVPGEVLGASGHHPGHVRAQGARAERSRGPRDRGLRRRAGRPWRRSGRARDGGTPRRAPAGRPGLPRRGRGAARGRGGRGAAWDDEAGAARRGGSAGPFRAAPDPDRPRRGAARRAEAGLSQLRAVDRARGPAWRRQASGPLALRHEVAHQLLFEACPAASGDRLFHEAFALAASGELRELGGRRGGRSRTSRSPARSRSSPARWLSRARAASTAAAPAARWPGSSRSRRPCAGGSRWRWRGRSSRCEAGRRLDAAPAPGPGRRGPLRRRAGASLSRHSGEVLAAEGAAAVPLPFGSTLKPFLLAGAVRPTPLLRPDPSRLVWRCGEALPPAMDAATALLRSCNGWFLDWAARDRERRDVRCMGPGAARPGALRPPLRRGRGDRHPAGAPHPAARPGPRLPAARRGAPRPPGRALAERPRGHPLRPPGLGGAGGGGGEDRHGARRRGRARASASWWR